MKDTMLKGIGLTGFMKSGKNRFAEHMKICMIQFEDINRVWQFAFADALKAICMKQLGLTKQQVNTQEGKNEYNAFWGMTNREILQRIGTEAMRNGFCQDVWVKILEKQLIDFEKPGSFFIVTDVRFENEAKMIKDHGGMIVKIDRQSVNPTDIEHISEQPLPDDMIDYTVDNNSDIINLRNEACRLKEYIKRLYWIQ